MRSSPRRSILQRLARSTAGAWVAAQAVARRPARAQPAGRIVGFDHVAAPMQDAEAMTGFYRSLGFVVNEGERICSVHCGDHKINFHRPALWQDTGFSLRASAAKPPCGDFCFVWNGSEEGLAEMLRRAGATVIEGPVECRGGQNAGTAVGVSRYTRDPDGNLLEFIVYR